MTCQNALAPFMKRRLDLPIVQIIPLMNIMRYVSVCTEGMLIHSWPCSAFVQNVISKKLCVAKKKKISTHISVCSILYILYFSQQASVFVPPWVPPPAQLQALPWGPLDLSGLVGTDERDRWKPASYLTHTLAEQLSKWASLKPWGRPEGTMQRWHLHHRQHFTVYPSGWGNWSFTFHISAAWVALS